jgi:hypothetical protein
MRLTAKQERSLLEANIYLLNRLTASLTSRQRHSLFSILGNHVAVLRWLGSR